ncbi:5-(carboxyamino)imidazole ribonucleotide mutase [Aerococcaceae bacterium DSM 111022]|nr:5-(carboxyamino)imidazole ribonucleotide mutase [Aerococcaceae bacterium DSM 111022]
MMITIVMGSSSDKAIAKKVVDQLKEFGVEYKVLVISAHRALDLLLEEVAKDEADVYIAMAGKAAHLAGVLAGATTKPVIGIPVKSSTLDGLDALLSTVQMPSGVPVATVAIDGGQNAAILATQILALQDEKLAQKLKDYKVTMQENVVKMNDDIQDL